jgi:hypothetical protein
LNRIIRDATSRKTRLKVSCDAVPWASSRYFLSQASLSSPHPALRAAQDRAQHDYDHLAQIVPLRGSSSRENTLIRGILDIFVSWQKSGVAQIFFLGLQ